MQGVTEKKLRMTMLFMAMGLAVVCASCFNRMIIAPAEDAEYAVEDFMDAMVDGDQDDLKELISPSWLAKNKVNIDSVSVNQYYPEDYEIVGQDGKDMKVLLHMPDGSTRYLWFRVVIEDDEPYILPAKLEGNVIQPWQKTEEGPKKE